MNYRSLIRYYRHVYWHFETIIYHSFRLVKSFLRQTRLVRISWRECRSIKTFTCLLGDLYYDMDTLKKQQLQQQQQKKKKELN